MTLVTDHAHIPPRARHGVLTYHTILRLESQRGSNHTDHNGMLNRIMLTELYVGVHRPCAFLT